LSLLAIAAVVLLPFRSVERGDVNSHVLVRDAVAIEDERLVFRSARTRAPDDERNQCESGERWFY